MSSGLPGRRHRLRRRHVRYGVALFDEGLAIVGTAEGEEEVSVALVVAGIADTVLAHAGEAIAVMPK